MDEQNKGIDSTTLGKVDESGLAGRVSPDWPGDGQFRDTDKYPVIPVGQETNTNRRHISQSVCTRINALFNNCRVINRPKKLTAWIIFEGELREVNLVKPHHEMGDMLLFHEALECENSAQCKHWLMVPAWVPFVFNLYN